MGTHRLGSLGGSGQRLGRLLRGGLLEALDLDDHVVHRQARGHPRVVLVVRGFVQGLRVREEFVLGVDRERDVGGEVLRRNATRREIVGHEPVAATPHDVHHAEPDDGRHVLEERVDHGIAVDVRRRFRLENFAEIDAAEILHRLQQRLRDLGEPRALVGVPTLLRVDRLLQRHAAFRGHEHGLCFGVVGDELAVVHPVDDGREALVERPTPDLVALVVVLEEQHVAEGHELLGLLARVGRGLVSLFVRHLLALLGRPVALGERARAVDVLAELERAAAARVAALEDAVFVVAAFRHGEQAVVAVLHRELLSCEGDQPHVHVEDGGLDHVHPALLRHFVDAFGQHVVLSVFIDEKFDLVISVVVFCYADV